MSTETVKEQELQVYPLENGRVLVQYGNVLLGGVTGDKAQSIIHKLLNGMNEKEFVADTQRLSIRKMFVLEIDDISNISTSMKGDQSVLLTYRKATTNTTGSTRMEFKDEKERQRFLSCFQELIGHKFKQVEKTNTRIASVRLPFSYFIQHTILGFALAYFVYYLETASEYSLRIPVWLYFLVELLLKIGYEAVFAIVGVIALILLINVIRRWIVPTKLLVLERINA